MTDLERAHRRLDEALSRADRIAGSLPDLIPALVDSVRSDGAVNLLIRGELIPGVPVSAGYQPTKDDVAQVLYVRGQYWVMGRTGVATGEPPTEPAPDTLARVPTSSGTYQPVMSGTYTPAGWSADTRPRQGGTERGLWFFGPGAWSGLGGTTVTGCRLTVTRALEEHGDWSGVPIYLWTHPHPAPTATAPVLATGPSAPGRLSLGERATFTLPTEFGIYLRDHPDGGIGIYVEGEAYYMICQTGCTVEVDWS